MDNLDPEFLRKSASAVHRADTNSMGRDFAHKLLRCTSLDVLEEMLEHCRKSKCPAMPVEAKYFLADVSVEGYVEQKAKYSFDKGRGKDNDERWCHAAKRKDVVFKCTKIPDFDTAMIQADAADMADSAIRESAINRKAFWAHQSRGARKRDGNPNSDFCDAKGFVAQVTSLGANNIHQMSEPKKSATRATIQKNQHLASGIDLFRFCLCRSNKRVDV